jgi:hypothetical protein
MSKCARQAPIAGEQTQQKPCHTSSDIGAEQENHTVGRGPMHDQKGLKQVARNAGADSYTAMQRMACSNSRGKAANQSKD